MIFKRHGKTFTEVHEMIVRQLEDISNTLTDECESDSISTNFDPERDKTV